MKVKIRLGLLIAIVTFFSACDNFDEVQEEFSEFTFDPTAEVEKVNGTWDADRVVYEFLDVTSEFQGFQLTFNGDGSWTAVNGSPLFESNGSWAFVEGDVTQIDFGNNIIADIAFSIDDDQNIMTMLVFTNGSSIGGRTSGLGGDYLLEFSKIE